MKLSRSDVIATAAGLLVIGGLSTLLYLDMTRRLGSGTQAEIGTVIMKRNVAQRKYSAQVVWEEVSTKAPLFNFDTVRTDDLSEAVIRLKDGTEITLNENSMILLTLSQDTMDIKFMQGAIQARRDEKAGSKGTAVTISGQKSTVSIGNGDVSFSRDAGTDLRLTVNRGKATLKSSQGEQRLNENQNAVSTDEDVRVQDLALRLAAPAGNQTVLTEGLTAPVAFSWGPAPAGWLSILEIARDPGFTDMTRRLPVQGLTRTLQLPTGIYYWRLTAKDRRRGTLQQSEGRKLSVIRHRPLRLFAPLNQAQLPYRDAMPLVSFNWSESSLGSRYTLELSRDPAMKPLVSTQTLTTPGIALTPPGEGTYYWRVTETADLPGLEQSPPTPVHQFTIVKTDSASPPEPLYPPDGRPVAPAVMAGQGLRFSWRASPLASGTRIVIAATNDFSAPLVDQTTDGNSLLIRKELAEGIYFWRVTGTAGSRPVTEPSPGRSFTISTAAGISLLAPVEGASLAAGEPGKGTVTFSWKQPDARGIMVLELAGDESFATVTERRKTEDLSATIANLSAGNWHWRVRVTGEGGRDLLKSGTRRFSLVEKLPNPVVTAPRAGSVVAMKSAAGLDISWQNVPGATAYRVSLYQQKKGGYQALMTVETAQTAASFRDFKKLEEGRCLWTIQAIDATGDRPVRRSDEVRVPFSITAGLGEKKIKIKSPKILYIE